MSWIRANRSKLCNNPIPPKKIVRFLHINISNNYEYHFQNL